MLSLLCSIYPRERIYQLGLFLHRVRRVTVRCMCVFLVGIAVLVGNLALAGQADVPSQGVSGSGDELLDVLTRRIAELTPDKVIETELLPGEMRLLGCDVPDEGTSNLRQASHFGLTLYFECLPGIGSPFEKEIVVSLGDIDIARVPFQAADLQPGEVVKRGIRLYVPRNAPTGKAELRAGFVRDGAPGESKRDLAARMAPLLTVRIQAADPLPRLPRQQRSALLKTAIAREPRNLLANGGFEEGFGGWIVDEDLLKGKGARRRALSVSVSRKVALEGRNSLRLDFGGGRDPDFYHIRQDATVKPSTEYLVSYFIKTEEITSNGPPGIMLRDPDKSAEEFYVATPEEMRMTGTRDWTRVEFTFRTPPDTRTLRVHVRRAGSGADRYWPDRYGPIGGSVWYDVIQLTEQQ